MSEADDIRSIINEAIRENSAHLIKATISATTEVLDQKLLEHTKGMKEIIDETIASFSKWQHTDFWNNVNENNFKHVQAIERLWDKTAQAIDNKRYPQAAEFCADGKLKLNKRLKLLCIADRELWSHYSRLPSETYMKPQNNFSTYLVLFLFTFIFRMLWFSVINCWVMFRLVSLFIRPETNVNKVRCHDVRSSVISFL